MVVNVDNIIGSFLDVPLASLLAAYMASLLGSYTRSKRREQDNVRRQRALLSVGETLVRQASDRHSLLQHSAEQIRKGGHFGRLVLALLVSRTDKENNNGQTAQVEIDSYIEVGVVEAAAPDESKALLERVIQTGEKLISFKHLNAELNEVDRGSLGIARLYLPFFKEGQLYMVLGAESMRQMPFDEKPEEFLTIVGAQLLIALENMRLTEQTAELAASAERGRIAREIHDGIAQLIYMLSLNTEACVALAERIEREAESGELGKRLRPTTRGVVSKESNEEADLLHPLTERLEKLVTISKQALWETRHYMFSLKPLISGTTTMTQMLTNQLHEFEAISGLPVQFEVEGNEETSEGDRRRIHTTAQVGAAIFRITQEALTNAYKHADATQIRVHLRYLPQTIDIEICDNGKGLHMFPYNYDLSVDGKPQRIYSGHGIRGMRDRTEELGGTFEIKQAATGGVCIHACIPR